MDVLRGGASPRPSKMFSIGCFTPFYILIADFILKNKVLKYKII